MEVILLTILPPRVLHVKYLGSLTSFTLIKYGVLERLLRVGTLLWYLEHRTW